jgi:hypothetical protein
MMLQALLDIAVGFLVESVVGSPSKLGRDFQRQMHSYLDQRCLPGEMTAAARRRP